MNLNSEFEIWFEKFSEKPNNLTENSIKELLKIAYIEGFKQCEKTTPLYGKSDDGTIVEIPRDNNESLIENGGKWIDEDFDVDEWIDKRKDTKNEGK